MFKPIAVLAASVMVLTIVGGSVVVAQQEEPDPEVISRLQDAVSEAPPDRSGTGVVSPGPLGISYADWADLG